LQIAEPIAPEPPVTTVIWLFKLGNS